MTELNFTQEELETITDALDLAYADADEDGRYREVVKEIREKLNRYADPYPSDLRLDLLEHQKATDCSDDHMVQILCDFIEKLDNDGQLEAPWYQWLMGFVVERLERLPGDIP